MVKITNHGLVTVGGKRYVHKTYGTGRVWDEKLSKWRRPKTAAEKRLQKRMTEALRNSLKEI